jgi:4-hydroxybenzoate polyprenyltransferase
MIKYLFKAMRPKQWVKNMFIFAALVFDRKLFDIPSLVRTAQAFLLFCLLASSVYLINDIMDREADKLHPVKKNRPIASGKLSISLAVVTAVLFTAIALTGAYLLNLNTFLFFLAYFLLNLAYSKWLKHIPLVDVLVLATFFVLRVAIGVSVIQVDRFSPWLYVVMTLLSLYIGLGKRRAELLVLVPENTTSHRKVLAGYSLDLIDQLITIVSAATIMGYSLYTFSAPNLPENHSMMLTIPFVLYGIFRYLSLIQIGKKGGEPEDLLIGDRPLQITVLLWGIAVLLVFYLSK